MTLRNTNRNESNTSTFKKLNIVLIIAIIVSAAVLIALTINFSKSNEGSKNNLGLTVKSIIPTRDDGIINGHEHIENLAQGPKWLEAMDQTGISTTIILGSPDATFYLHPSGPFNKYNENNEELLKLVDKYPDRFIAFPTIYTYDDLKLESLKNYLKRGALGLKLFSGHFASFYDTLGPLNVSTMYPVYEFCERERVPIIWHVHLGKEELRLEFEEVMKDFPELICTVPHFMLSSIDLWQTEGEGRLRYYLETYPNLYTDISFGYWVKDGLWRLSNNTAEFREFLIEFQDRFTFGTDMVCTKHPRKTVEWVANLTQGYIDILEKKFFNLTVKYDIEGDFNGDNPGTHSGLYLPQDVLDKIYYENIIKFLNGKYYYENLTDVIKTSKLTYASDKTRATSDEQLRISIKMCVEFSADLIAVEKDRC